MRVVYNPDLKADITLDDTEKVRNIHHSQEYFLSNSNSALLASISYIEQISSILRVSMEQMSNLAVRVSYLDPEEKDTEYRLSDEKQFFDTTTFGFYQTYLNVPVWQAGISVTVKHAPYRVISATNTSQEGFDAKLPSKNAIERYKKMFALASVGTHKREIGFVEDKEDETADFIRGLIKRGELQKSSTDSRRKRNDDARMIRGRFYVYRYDEKNRLPPGIESSKVTSRRRQKEDSASPMFPGERSPILPLPPVDKRIEDGKYYLVSEITFSFTTQEFGHLNWQALVEVETDSVLFLRALVASAHGWVFKHDPISVTGDAKLLPSSTNAVLNGHTPPLKTRERLSNVFVPAPGGTGIEVLVGSRISVAHVEGPDISSPIVPIGIDFNYDVRTNDFAAVNCYYHNDRFFALVESLGFSISSYFNGTKFPIKCDHRGITDPKDCPGGNCVNAHCNGNGTGGIDHCCYALADTGDTANPIGIASDWRVILHELGGHGVLYEHVNSANFGFSHSAGDSIAVIMSDPESQAPDRFVLAPFVPVARRHDRDVAAGWAWGGTEDIIPPGATDEQKIRIGYQREQILSTTLFRVYRSIGGDHPDIGRKRFAARMMTYLILRAIGGLTQFTNPGSALDFCNKLLEVDKGNWTTEGMFGGAYNKVIRWSFEKQGLFQAPGSTALVSKPGQPPQFDVYIDDGRRGEYQFQSVHWKTTTIWNRRIADGDSLHQEPAFGIPNYAYVKIKNRGTQTAKNVKVRAYHTRPGAGLLWPKDFEALSTAEISVGTLAPNNTAERTVGPFKWTPSTNAYGHDCMLMIVSCDDDPGNTDNFTLAEVIPDWRLVPNDNNIGQRNVVHAPGGSGIRGLMKALDNVSLWIGNPNFKTAIMELRIKLPELLALNNWRISIKDLSDNKFELEPGKKKEVFLELHPGAEFEKGDIERSEDRDIDVLVYADGMLIGGMTYRLDPDLEEPYNKRQPIPGREDKCNEKATDLLECLDISGQKVRNVHVKNVVLDIKLEDECT
jgi:zinc metalloprotease ZmpB